MTSTSRPSLLIIAFSPIAGDARVLKQVGAFHERYDVTTCGYGAAPEGVVEHLRIPDEAKANDTEFKLIAARLWRAAYSTTGAVRAARDLLRGRHFDVVLADDVETVPLALELAPAHRVHADLHEYSPRLHDEIGPWMRWRAPYVRWMCRRHVARVASTSTVGAGLARQYEADFGFRPKVVTNATPYVDLSPGEVGDPVRLVHSGAALRNRDLMLLLDGVIETSRPVTLDLFLTPNDPGYLAELRQRAQGSGGRVTVHDAVPYANLITTLNRFDVGVHILPPVNFNNRNALPNKFFDYVQARLGLVVGPSPEMARTVRDRGIGLVTSDFSAHAFAAALDDLDAASVARFKEASNAAAREMSAESQVVAWVHAIDALAGVPA